MLDKIKEYKLNIISVLAIIFVLLVILSFIVPTFGYSSRPSHAIQVIERDFKYSWKLILMYSVLIISPLALLINLKLNDNNSKILLISLALMLFGIIFLINSILSDPINDYQRSLIKYMFLRYFAIVDIVGILIVSYIELIEDKLN